MKGIRLLVGNKERKNKNNTGSILEMNDGKRGRRKTVLETRKNRKKYLGAKEEDFSQRKEDGCLKSS